MNKLLNDALRTKGYKGPDIKMVLTDVTDPNGPYYTDTLTNTVVFDRTMLANANRDEILNALGHEFGHYSKEDNKTGNQTIANYSGEKLEDRTKGMVAKEATEDTLAAIRNNKNVITGEEGKGVIPSLLVQYRENDWNFIRRIAALKKTVVMPDYQSKGVKYFFGMPKRDTKVLTSQDVRIVVNKEYTVYEVKSREIHSLGDRVSFNRKDYRIVKIVSKTEGSELYHTYYLTQDIDYIVKKESKFDLKIIGASLYAKVTKVEKEKVKIAIEEIENKDEEIGRWFDFSTVYSSKDGAGWYCMPEKGDSVRLYFPTENEENAYVCSAIHENEGSGVRTDPENKIWRNKYGKEIRLTPDGIRISAGTGDYIELKDDEGVNIVSSGSIHIKAKDTLEISSEESNISIAAAKRIMLLQDGTQIILKDGISVSGDGVHIS